MTKRHMIFTAAGVVVVSLACIAGVLFRRHRQANAPRHAAAEYARQFAQRLNGPGSPGNALREMVLLPPVYGQRTTQEQEDFVRKALKDEISDEGLGVLSRIADFGPLPEVFPDKADVWTKPHGIAAEDCVAFRASRDGLTAELVLLRFQGGYRIVRCNNVKQLAEQNPK